MLRELPAVHRLLAEPRIGAFCALLGSETVKSAIDDELRAIRTAAEVDGSRVPSRDEITVRIGARLEREARAGLVEVLNGSGVLLHTNLGRAPLAAAALDAMRAVGSGYSNLEYDLEAGTRGSRYERVTSLLRAATGAEDCLVVNNCAAAVLLVLDTFAKGREVVVSRNQLVEIGGGFRLPDVLAQSGARLVEVGTTNKVRLHDFERALGVETALFMRSHPSNYRIEGFVEDVVPREIVALGKRVGVPVMEDLGSGALVDLEVYGLPHERTVQEAVADGLDLVAFSGDKLLGGPQAGIIVGKASMVARMRANPLLRALRVDKATLAALGATLRLHLDPQSREQIPFYAMLGATRDALRERAKAVAATLADSDTDVRVVDTEAFAGGGTLPLATIPSAGVALAVPGCDPNTLSARLRRAQPPLVARAEGAAVIVDLRTIPPDRDGDVIEILLREAQQAQSRDAPIIRK